MATHNPTPTPTNAAFELFHVKVIDGLDIYPAVPGQMWLTYKEQPLPIPHAKVKLSSVVKVPQHSSKSYTSCYLELLGNYAFCKMNSQSKGMVPRCYMDLRYARVETAQSVIGGKLHYIIIIANRDVFENLHFEDPLVFDHWLQELTRYCVFGQVEKYFTPVPGGTFGEGAYGEVYLAVNNKNPEDKVVVKTYTQAHMEVQPGQKKPKKNNPGEMVFDEINILRKLDHPNILKLRMVFEEPGVKTLVTDYYEGGDLFRHMCKNNHCLNWREALEYIKGILTGLAYLEKYGVVHRDIKLGNIALKFDDGSHNVAILDFGFSIRIKDCKRIPKKFGTVGFYAPEVLAGVEMFDCRADVYSTGILLFTMISGQSAFDYTDLKDCVAKNTNGQVNWAALHPSTAPQKIPDDVLDLVKKLLAPRKSNRPFASEALKHKSFELLKLSGNVPLPRRSNNSSSFMTLEEDMNFFVTEANEAKISEISEHSFNHQDGTN